MEEAEAERKAEEEEGYKYKVVKETPVETLVTTYFEFPGNFTTKFESVTKVSSGWSRSINTIRR